MLRQATGRGYARIDPAMIGADRIGELARIVVGMMVTERVLRVPVQILPSMKDTARLMSGSAGMAREKITPPGPCGESGGDQVPGIIGGPKPVRQREADSW